MKTLAITILSCGLLAAPVLAQKAPKGPSTRSAGSLVASYSFNGTLNDQTGTSHGTGFGTTFVEDRFGNPGSALSFNGVDSYADLGDAGMPNEGKMHDSLTVSLWVKVDPTSAPGGIFTRRTNADQAYTTLYYNPDFNVFVPNQGDFNTPVAPRFIWQADGPFYFSAFRAMKEPVFERWHHLVVSKLGNKTVMYLDGVKADSAADDYDYQFNGSFTGFGNVILGMTPAWNGAQDKSAFRGLIDDVKIYKGALRDEEVDDIFDDETKPPAGPWSMRINASKGSFTAWAVLGMHPDATDGLDQALDTPEPPQANGPFVRVYFDHPGWNGSLSGTYLRDFRPVQPIGETAVEWPLFVHSDSPGSILIHFSRPDGMTEPVTVINASGQRWTSVEGDLLFETEAGNGPVEHRVYIGPEPVASESFAPIPKSAVLHANYPNPFNPGTTVAFELPAASAVSLKVYTAAGQEVATLVSGNRPAGLHSVYFDASGLASGVYLYRLDTAGQSTVRKMVLVK